MALRHKRTNRNAGDSHDGGHLMMKTGWRTQGNDDFYVIPFNSLERYVRTQDCYSNSNTMLALIAGEGDALPRERAMEYERQQAYNKPHPKRRRIDKEPQVRIGYNKKHHPKHFEVAGKFIDSYVLPKAFFRINRSDNAKIPSDFSDEVFKISVTLLRLIASTSYFQIKYNMYIDNMTYNKMFEKECKAEFLDHPFVKYNGSLPENEKIIDLNNIIETAPKHTSKIKISRIINARPLDLKYYEDHSTYAHLGLIMLTLTIQGSLERNNYVVTLCNNFCLDKNVLDIQKGEPLPNSLFREMVMCFLDCAEILQYGEIRRDIEERETDTHF